MTLVVRRIIDVGDSKAVVVPRAWLESQQKDTGHPVETVELREEGQSLVITPIILQETKTRRR